MAIKKSKKNTANKPSAAKKQGMEREANRKKIKTVKKVNPKTKPKAGKHVSAKPTFTPYNIVLKELEPKKPKQLPDTPLSRKGMTLRKLYRVTPRLFIENAKEVLVKSIKKRKTKSGMPVVTATAYTSDPFRPLRMRREHVVHVIGLDKTDKFDADISTPITEHKKVLVSCSCESYVYGGGEYANAAHGASRILYGNGKPPVVTNPKMSPFLCKHLVNVVEIMFKSKL